MGESDTPLIDHLVKREFVSGLPSYRFIYERVRDRKPSLRKGSWAVCGFRTEFFEKRQFFGSSFSFWVPSVSRDLTVCWLNITYTCFVYTVTDVDGRSPRQVSANLIQNRNIWLLKSRYVRFDMTGIVGIHVIPDPVPEGLLQDNPTNWYPVEFDGTDCSVKEPLESYNSFWDENSCRRFTPTIAWIEVHL